jgi:hypothetical protein
VTRVPAATRAMPPFCTVIGDLLDASEVAQ